MVRHLLHGFQLSVRHVEIISSPSKSLQHLILPSVQDFAIMLAFSILQARQ